MRTRAGRVIVLDTWAMLAYLKEEPAAQQVRQLLRRARRRKVLVLFSLINYGECMYVIERGEGIGRAEDVATVIDELPLLVVAADRPLEF